MFVKLPPMSHVFKKELILRNISDHSLKFVVIGDNISATTFLFRPPNEMCMGVIILYNSRINTQSYCSLF